MPTNSQQTNSRSRRRPERAPIVALVGRTNVGKSTLFNKLIEEGKAIVSSVSGTTRDRSYGTCRWSDHILTIVDTGGLDVSKTDVIEAHVLKQAKIAIKEADLILFIVDVTTGILPQDRELSKALFRGQKPVLLVANKADNPRNRRRAAGKEWLAFGRGAPIPVSAVNGSGVGDLLDEVVKQIGEKVDEQVDEAIRIAIIGKPNVGKSTLTNQLLKEERMIVSPIPGTTREPQDTLLIYEDQKFVLVDTVGVRKRKAIKPGMEKMGIKKTLRAINRADVIFFIVDLSESIGAQDRHLAAIAAESGKAVVLIGNKWDKVKEKTPGTLGKTEKLLIERDLRQLKYAIVRVLSAETGARADGLFDDAVHAWKNWQREIPEKALDSFFRKMLTHKKKFGGAVHPYIYRMRQRGVRPPTFTLAIKAKRKAKDVPVAYLRFVEHRLREIWDFSGTPIRVIAKYISLTSK